MTYNFKDKVAVVTGGNDGIGKGIAEQLADNGANVVLVARRAEVLQQVVGKLQTDYKDQSFSYVSADLTNPENVQRIIDHVQEKYGKLDILVNSVGAGVFKPLDELTQEDYDFCFKMNLHTKRNMVDRAIQLLEQSKGVIINISSESALKGMPLNGAYGSSMAAVNNYTQNLVTQYGQKGIMAYAICPGNVDTRVFRKGFVGVALSKDKDSIKPVWHPKVIPAIEAMNEEQREQWMSSGTVKQLDEGLATKLLTPTKIGNKAVELVQQRPEELIHFMESIEF